MCLEFSAELGITGYLASMRSGRMQLSTQIINKQEVYMQSYAEGERLSHDSAWCVRRRRLLAPM